MEVDALLINPETDGGMPVSCQIKVVGERMQFWCLGNRGWIIQVPINSILNEIVKYDREIRNG